MENESSSDAELMARVGRNDMAALGLLAHRHQARVLSLAYRLLGDWHRAEDVAQDTFLRVRRAAGAYEPQAKFTTWLYRIVHNLSMDQHRKVGASLLPLEAVEEPRTEDPSRDDPVEKAELAERVRKAIAQLPDRQRQVVVLHRYEGLSHVEIGEVTGWSKSAVESLLVRAYENLRKNLAQFEDFSR
ncbi:MAG: sigma-70 family RNA polymerase sigma factor [Phycisphaerae bacterium]|nr:sigma-70 family RNA polymerase sigma factor [Phycisphaerae bacterium]